MDAEVSNVTPDSFQADVIERSQTLPVVVVFWADQVPESVQTKNLVATLVEQSQGKVGLALSDVAADQTLAQHLRVQGLPSIRIVHEGKIVEQIDGPADETQLRTVLDTLTQSPADMIKGQLDQIVAAGDWDSAVAILQEQVNAEPANQALRVELADVLVCKGDLDDARTVLASIPEDTAERERPQNRLEFVEEAAGMGSLAEVAALAQSEPDNLETKYQLAVLLLVDGQIEEGLEAAMDILRKDREFREDIGRLTMIRAFAMLGKGDEMATRYRRKMFNFMH